MAYETILVGYLRGRVSFALTGNATPDPGLSTEINDSVNAALREFLRVTESACLHAEATFPMVLEVSVTDGVTNGTNTLTSAAALALGTKGFTAAMIGRPIVIGAVTRNIVTVPTAGSVTFDGAVIGVATGITVLMANSDYALADDVHRIIEAGVRINASPWTTLSYMTAQQFDAWRGAQNTNAGSPNTYLIRKRDPTSGKIMLTLFPKPSTTDPIVYRYVAIPANISAVADAATLDPRIPPQYHDGLFYGALCRPAFRRYFNDNDKAYNEKQWADFLQKARTQAQPVIAATYQRASYDPRVQSGSQQPLGSGPTGTYVSS